MKGDIYRKVLIVHLFFDVIVIFVLCLFFCLARNQAVESRTPLPTPARPCYPPELNNDPDGFTVDYDDHFGLV